MATQSPSGSATDNAKEQVQEKAQDAQEKLKGGAQQAQARMREQVDQRSTQAGEQVSASADALRTTSRQLREQGQNGPAQAAEKVADHAERLGGYLSESNADRILGDLEDFGRRQPMAVIALGVAAGFAASRFLKASSRQRYEGRAYGTPSNGTLSNGAQAAPTVQPTPTVQTTPAPQPPHPRVRRMSTDGQGHVADPREQSIGELVKDLAGETSTLVRQEIDLAKAEMTERGKQIGKGAGILGAAALVGLLAAGALTACLIAALDLAMATWVAALVVTVVFGAIAAVLAMTGRKQIQEAAPPVPEQAIDSVKEDVQWAKTRTRSATK